MESASAVIAVVGLGCILPDATSPTAVWTNTLRGHSSLRPLSCRTYNWSCYKRDSEHAAWVFDEPIGAEIGVHSFDWRKFRIPPLDAQAINPMHLRVLEAGAQALGEVSNIPHATTSVFIGGTGLGWQRDSGLRIRLPSFLEAADRAGHDAGISGQARREMLDQVRQSMEQRLRPVSDDGVVNSLGSIAAGRLALRFDLRGPHAGIDAGFASGLAAVATAAQLLRDGTIDLAIAGGASESITPLDLIAFHQLSVLAHRQVRPFDAAAEGTLLGEGVALFALKRLEDALAHGEQIYALLRGIGAASDGRSKSLLAPSVEHQSLAMERAYADANLDPKTVGYVECHATGTPVGDACEIRALARVFGPAKGSRVAVGSAKSFVGHLRGASGAVGMLRAVLALHHRTIPAQIGFEKPHPNLELGDTQFFVPTTQSPLEPKNGAPSARAAVSSFGLGGNNYHAVFDAWTPSAHRRCTVSVSAARQPTVPVEPIAIVGLGGVLPNADGVPAFWKTLLEGQDATREIPASRWAIDRYYDPDQNRPDKTYTRVGCFVDPVPDPGKEFRVPPIARSQIDPGHVLAFHAAEEAVADAKLEAGNWDRNRTAVILGFIGCQGRRLLAEARLNFREFEAELEHVLRSSAMPADQVNAILSATERVGIADLPSVTEDTLPGYLGSFNAARIARRFDLRGPHFVVDSACASSLAALQVAARLLRQGVVDTVLVGGVWADGQPEFFIENCRFSALSASAITPFDERASGFVPGEGAAVMVLRRLADAERDGQRIHALIRSVEGSTDGAAGRSIYSPSAEGESLSMQRALDAAGIAANEVDYVECHGTGTALGDVIEIQACTRAYGRGRQQPLLVGSVKSNIGHLMAGAGAVALLKTTLAIREGTIPASIKVRTLNPKIDFTGGPVEVVTTTTSWQPGDGRPRRAGVSGFGLGGANFHALLEEYRPSKPAGIEPGCDLTRGNKKGTGARRTLPIATAAGADPAACASTLVSLATNLLHRGSDRFWTAIASSQEDAAGSDPWRVAIVAERPELLAQRATLLNASLTKGHDPSFLRAQGIFVAHAEPSYRVAAVFPGQGPQYPNMLRGAEGVFPELALTLDRMDRAYERICGRKLRPSFYSDDAQSYLQRDEDIHCAVFAVNVAIFELLESYGARIDSVMGQSAGELSALVAARSISIEDGLRAIRERTLAVLGIKTQDPGRMVTLACGVERASQVMRDLPGYAAIAADNAPSACIVSGDQSAIKALLTRAADEGIEANILAVSHGYHSQLIAGARPAYRKALDSIAFCRPERALFSSITGDSIDRLPLADYAAHLESQFVEPVRLRQAVAALYQSGVRVFVECGPKWPLTSFISEILAGRPHIAQPTIHPKVGEVEQLHRAIASLFVHRVCALSPARKSTMSRSISSNSLESAAQPPTPSAQPTDAFENKLVAVLRTIRDIIDAALNPIEVTETEPSPQNLAVLEHSASIRPSVEVDPLSKSDVAIAHASVTSTQSSVASNASQSPASVMSPQDISQRVHALLVAELVTRSGYPEEMLEPDLDLEAELGIDTVKQVASIAAVREYFKLAADPKFRMHDARTLRQAVDYLVARLSGAASHQPSLSTSAPKVQTVAESVPQYVAVDSTPATVAVTVTLRMPSATSPAIPSEDVRQGVHSMLVTELVKRTGYPEEMIELDLDLEAELGIDTVKQVASLAAVRERYGLEPDPKFRMQDARTLRQAVDYLVGRISSVAVQFAPSPAPVFEADTRVEAAYPRASATPAPGHVISSVEPTKSAISAPKLSAAATNADSVSDDVRHLLVAELVHRTGYPEDMLELDLDLEAELGIDTVKQVAALAAVREKFKLQPDPKFRMQDARTLRQAIDYIAGRVATVSYSAIPVPAVQPTVLPDLTTHPIEPRELRSISQVPSNSNAEMLATPQQRPSEGTVDISSTITELQQSLKALSNLVHQAMRDAPTATDTGFTANASKVAARPSAASHPMYPEDLLESLLTQAGCPPSGEILEVTRLAVAGKDSVLSVVTPPADGSSPLQDRDSGVMEIRGASEQHQIEDPLLLHVRNAEYQIVAWSKFVQSCDVSTSAVTEMLAAVREGEVTSNKSLLHEYLDKCGRASWSCVEWAHSHGFTLTVGGAHVPGNHSNPTRVMLDILGCAYDVASFAWFGLAGTLHSLSGIERLRLHRIPTPGDELLICARMAQPESGLWRADVEVFETRGGLFAQLSGLEGAPITSSGSCVQEASDPAGRAWQSFARRLGRKTSSG